MSENIQYKKLLYHLTSLQNVPSILRSGLKPRALLSNFEDVADQEIISSRRALGLESHVPFHWFSLNPFDGRVQQDRPFEQFVLMTVRRALAEQGNWKVIPCHPLANSTIQLLDYNEGFAQIDWEAMNQRDYHNPVCKSICMAECLSPKPVPSAHFFKIYTANDRVADAVAHEIAKLRLSLEVQANGNMFLR